MFVAAAGMYRSGSTWQFNAARLLLNHLPDFWSGWLGNDGDGLRDARKHENGVGKLHSYVEEVREYSDFIMTCSRDVRSVVASCYRTGGGTPIKDPIEWLGTDVIPHYEKWVKIADFNMMYEEFIIDPKREFDNLYNLLKAVTKDIESSKLKKVYSNLTNLEKSDTTATHHSVTLMHKNHISHGGIRSWYNLDKSIVSSIEKSFPDYCLNEYKLQDLENRFNGQQ